MFSDFKPPATKLSPHCVMERSWNTEAWKPSIVQTVRRRQFNLPPVEALASTLTLFI
jgi:hypothetical protein